jgi:outer membrane protein
MRAKVFCKYFLFLLIFYASNSGAQNINDKATPVVWTLQQCLDFANQNNYEINTLRLTRASDQQDLLLSKAAKDPNLSGNSTHFLTNTNPSNPVAGVYQSRLNFASNYSLGSSVILFNGNYLNNDIKQKKLTLESSDLNVKASLNNITLQITQAYLNILFAKENIIYLQDLVNTSQAQQQQGQFKYNAGSIALKDLVQLEAQSATDKYNLVTAQNLERQNTLTLKALLQLPYTSSLNVVQPDTVIAVSTFTPLEETEQTALAQRPEVKSSEIQQQVAQLNLLKSRAAGKPYVTASGLLATGYAQPGSYITQLDNNFYQRLGLTLAIPIFNNRTVKTNIEKSKIAIEQSGIDLQNTKTTLSQEVEQAYINVLNAQSQYNAAVVLLDANKENYRISADQLRLGGISTVDYLLQKNLYVQALQEYIQAKYNAVISVKIYEFYNGTPVKL